MAEHGHFKLRCKPQVSIGIVFTVTWFGLIAAYLAWRWPDAINMRPNEFGDFCAGAFAPPAFLWLLLGYFLQAQELRLQVKELSHQVEATVNLATAANKSGERELRNVQPVFHISIDQINDGPMLHIRNIAERGSGRIAIEVELFCSDVLFQGNPWVAKIMQPCDSHDIEVDLCEEDLELKYTDNHGNRWLTKFRVPGVYCDQVSQLGKPVMIDYE